MPGGLGKLLEGVMHSLQIRSFEAATTRDGTSVAGRHARAEQRQRVRPQVSHSINPSSVCGSPTIAEGEVGATGLPGCPTPAEIEAARTPNGGWCRETLAGWGVGWPPAKGWKLALLAASKAATTQAEAA